MTAISSKGNKYIKTLYKVIMVFHFFAAALIAVSPSIRIATVLLPIVFKTVMDLYKKTIFFVLITNHILVKSVTCFCIRGRCMVEVSTFQINLQPHLS